MAVCPVLGAATNRVETFALNPQVPTLDGQWFGITVASDGNCYFASSSHSPTNGASFWRYNPRRDALTLLARDITPICGEDPSVTPPQGKIHSPIVECDGWLYFGTHLANYWPDAGRAYTGGHVIGYELATGRFRDFGVIHTNYTIYAAVAVDCLRRKLWVPVTSWNPDDDETNAASHIYRIDIDSGAKEDMGAVQPGDQITCFGMFIDGRGDCWFSLWFDWGTLMRIRADTGQLDRWESVLPEQSVGILCAWQWVQPLPDPDCCLFTITRGDWLWKFDAGRFRTNAPDTNAFVPIHNIGYSYTGVALSQDTVYYTQRADRQPGHQGTNDYHLLSVSLDPAAQPAIVDHGLIQDQDGRLAYRIPGLAADAEGRVFMIGDWYVLPGDVGSLRYYEDQGWVELFRGEFFAVPHPRPARLTARFRADPGSLELFWPTSSVVFRLETASNWISGNIWSPVADPGVISNGQHRVTLPRPARDAGFFRLSWP